MKRGWTKRHLVGLIFTFFYEERIIDPGARSQACFGFLAKMLPSGGVLRGFMQLGNRALVRGLRPCCDRFSSLVLAVGPPILCVGALCVGASAWG